MPEQARANGLWHGPDPAELSALSYAEAKVINLARVYVSVKRFFWTGAVMLRPQSRKLRCIIIRMLWPFLKILTLLCAPLG